MTGGELIELDYRTGARRTAWWRDRMQETAGVGEGAKFFIGTIFTLGVIGLLAICAQAVIALLGGQIGSASEYAVMAQMNKLIVELGFLVLLGGAVPVALMTSAAPTHILLDRDGLRLVARGIFPFVRKQIAWSDIDSIEFQQSAGVTSNELLVLHAGANVMKLKVSALTPDDRGRLLQAIRDWAPQAVQEPAVLRALTASKDQTYTELWLEAFTASPKRDSMRPLEKGALLNATYTVVDYLGMGGQGTAYLASRKANDAHERVVLKEFILPVFVDTSVRRQAVKSFENEMRILSSLDHANVVKLLDYFLADQRAYLVLEYVDGPSLKKLVEDQGRIPEKQALKLILQACSALEHLHAQAPPVVHRDVTPDNLILASDGTLKLVDFNVAHQAASGAVTTVVGKQAYIAPEQFRGQPTTQSDIYALGGTLFFLLTAEEPDAISTSRPKLVLEELSPRLDEIVAKATNVDASKRYKDVSAFAEELTTWLVEHHMM